MPIRSHVFSEAHTISRSFQDICRDQMQIRVVLFDNNQLETATLRTDCVKADPGKILELRLCELRVMRYYWIIKRRVGIVMQLAVV